MKLKCFTGIFACLLVLTISAFSQKLVFDPSFAPVVNNSISEIKPLSDGKIIITGKFSAINGVTRYLIARLNANGTLDETFNANVAVNGASGINKFINSIQILPDGKILISGSFGSGSPPEYIRSVLRLNPNGDLDTTMTSTPQILSENFAEVRKAVQMPNGKILACGQFSNANGNAKPNLVRYNNNGTYDSSFTLPMNTQCYDTVVQPDGKYLIANYNGGLTRFNADDTVDTTFSVTRSVSKLKILSDGKITAFEDSVIQFNSDGSIYREFAGMNASGGMAFQSNGKTLITSRATRDLQPGMSLSFNRFNADNTFDPTVKRYNLGNSDFHPTDVAVTADGKVIVVGSFTSVSIPDTTTNQRYILAFTQQAIPTKPKFDFDGDGKDDIALYRPSTGIWYVSKSTGGFSATQFGGSTDKPNVTDFDNDGKADISVYRDGVWYWLRSSDSAFAYRVAGQAGDVPQPRRSDAGDEFFIAYRPSDGKFYRQPLYYGTFAISTGLPAQAGNLPITADYDGDSRDDLAVFRDGNWYMNTTGSSSTRHYQFGIAGDKPVIGDFDGDLRTDYAVFRPSNGTWYIQKSAEGFTAVQWGLSDDMPVPADYDGDGKVDIAVFRPSNGSWYIIKSSGGYRFEQFGLSGDIPAQLK